MDSGAYQLPASEVAGWQTLLRFPSPRTARQVSLTDVLNQKIDPQWTRRNLVVSGINLLAFNNKQFQIGEDLVLEMTGYCHPCTRMEENLGAGGYNAMRGHGGITAKVIRSGVISLGDEVSLVVPPK